MNNSQVVYVTDNEWVGLYVDNKKVLEGHSLDTFEVIDYLHDIIYQCTNYEIRGNWLCVYGYLPDTFTELLELEDA